MTNYLSRTINKTLAVFILLAFLSVMSFSCGSTNSDKKIGDVDTVKNNMTVLKMDTSKLKETLVSLEKQSWEAWKNNDGNFYANFLSDDHFEVGAGGLSSKDEVVKFVGSKACTVKSYSVDQFNLIVLDDNTAALCYHAAQETMCGGSKVHSPVWVSSVYVNRNGKWVNAIYQQSANPNSSN